MTDTITSPADLAGYPLGSTFTDIQGDAWIYALECFADRLRARHQASRLRERAAEIRAGEQP